MQRPSLCALSISVLLVISGTVSAATPAPTTAKPITFTMPADGYVSLIIKNADGQVVHQLLNCEQRAKGRHTVTWDGLGTPNWTLLRKPNRPTEVPGAAAGAGKYSWSAIWHTGIGLRLKGWTFHGPSDPWDNGPKNYWGGDQALPIACASDGKNVYFGWAGSEAGKALIAMNADEDQVIWAAGRHFNGAGMVAVDGDFVYYASGTILKRVSVENGRPANWPGTGSGSLKIKSIWDDPTGMPADLSWASGGLEAHGGKIYLTFSQWTWKNSDIKDWKRLLTKVLADKDAGKGPAATLAKTFWESFDDRCKKLVTRFVAGEITEEQVFQKQAYWVPGTRDRVMGSLRKLLGDKTLVAGAEEMSGSRLAQANRRLIEKIYEGAIVKAYSNLVAVLDAKTGKVVKKFDADAPGRIAAGPDGVLYMISGRKKVVTFDPETGKTRLVFKSAVSLNVLTLDKQGNIYVAADRPLNQIHVYSPSGKLIRKMGKAGGRAKRGPWDPGRLLSVWGLAVDQNDRLWAAEVALAPMRMSAWDTKTGAFVKEYFGATHYGASGGAVNPHDPSILMGESCEFRLDPKTGHGKLLGVVTGNLQFSFARYCTGANGRLYLAASTKGPRWGKGVPQQIRLYERVGDGDYLWRSAIRVEGNKTIFWADENGDQIEQENETQTMKTGFSMGGYYHWSMCLNTDMTFYGVRRTDPDKGKGMQIKVGGFTKCGAPKYDLKTAKTLMKLNAPLSSPDNRFVVSCDTRDKLFRCYDIATGKLKWSYPNTFHGVHGSHNAPRGPIVGVIRGAFGFVGNAQLREPVGAVWAINTNVGEWHVLTEDGYYLTRLFQGDGRKRKYPKAQPGAVLDNVPPGHGGEDFGGSLVQGKDGKIYIQTGKTSLWSVVVVGLESVKALAKGTVSLSANDALGAQLARGKGVQAAAGARSAKVRKLTPKFTGDIRRDFGGAGFVSYQGGRVRSAAVWDKEMLYLAWDVPDATPWTNEADEVEYMYTSGDTVDFQIATKATAKHGAPVIGDLRLSIGSFNGKPAAVIYREVAAKVGILSPKTFSSGVIAKFVVADVRVLKDANIKVKIRKNGYSVEAAIPLAALGLKPADGLKLTGDFGVTHGDPKGRDTVLRTYWSNQATGIVNDEVFELKLEPGNWGELIFEAK